MKKYILLAGASAVAGSVALFGAGVAQAVPDVVGQKYSDAVSAIEDGGGSAKIASSIGGALSQDDCVVTNAWKAPFVRDGGDSYAHNDGEVMLALNCAGSYATGTHPGPSAASPEGKKAKAAEEEEKAQSGESGAEEEPAG